MADRVDSHNTLRYESEFLLWTVKAIKSMEIYALKNQILGQTAGSQVVHYFVV